MVSKGSISLRLEGEGGKAIWDRTVTTASIVGLPATLAGGRYSLTAVTLEECELGFVNRQALLQLVESDSGLGLDLMRALGDEVLQVRELLLSTPAA